MWGEANERRQARHGRLLRVQEGRRGGPRRVDQEEAAGVVARALEEIARQFIARALRRRLCNIYLKKEH